MSVLENNIEDVYDFKKAITKEEMADLLIKYIESHQHHSSADALEYFVSLIYKKYKMSEIPESQRWW
jgi:hypothetical protein